MEKIDLIQARNFGEKLNELTTLINDNFIPFLRKSWWLLLGIGLILALIIEFVPNENPVEACASFLLTAFVCVLVVIMFVSLVREVGIEQRPQMNHRTFFTMALVYGGRTLPTLLLPFALLCLLGGYLLSTLFSLEVTNSFGTYFLMLLVVLVIILAAAPLLQLVNVCVLEEKSGFTAVLRTIRLRRYKRFQALMFYFVIVLLSLLVPLVMDLPYLIYSVTRDIVTDEFGVAADPTIGEQIVQFLSTWIECCVFLLYLCLASLASLLEYGNAVEVVDNVHFLEKFNNFDNL